MDLNKIVKMVVSFGLVAVFFVGESQATTYSITDLGTLGGSESHAFDINNSGQVVGSSYGIFNSGQIPTVWSNGGKVALETYGRQYDPYGIATRINNNGQIIGIAGNTYNSPSTFWASSQSGPAQLSYGPLYFLATAINDFGVMAGSANAWDSTGQISHAYTQTIGGGQTDLGGKNSGWATAINSAGQVVGGTSSSYYTSRATLWDNGAMIDLGTLGGTSSYATSINDAGTVVGYSYLEDEGSLHAFQWSHGEIKDLGALSNGWSRSYALDINLAGIVVGKAYTEHGEHAVIWNGGVIDDLNNLITDDGWELSSAVAINDVGQIVGDGLINGQTHAFLLTPKEEVPPTINGTPITNIREGSSYNFVPKAVDSKNASLTFSITNKPIWASFDVATGALSGVAVFGQYSDITITVSNGSVSASLAPFTITVSADTAPTISGTPTTTIKEGNSYNFTPIVVDPDGDYLTFSVLNKPFWASFTSETGTLSGIAVAGEYKDIIITVSDGRFSSSLPPYSITVAPVTPALEFKGFLAPINGADATGGSLTMPAKTFKLNSTIPIKMIITSLGAPVISGTHTVAVVKYTGATDATASIDATPTDSATYGNSFRLVDSATGEWHFNLDSKVEGMTQGIWQIRVTLSTGEVHRAYIQLK